MGPDIYALADDLVLRLRGDGADRWADAVNEAIESGSTGTEILMALRHCVTDLMESGTASTRTLEHAQNLERELGRLLDG